SLLSPVASLLCGSVEAESSETFSLLVEVINRLPSFMGDLMPGSVSTQWIKPFLLQRGVCRTSRETPINSVFVTFAQAGVHKNQAIIDFRLCGNDINQSFHWHIVCFFWLCCQARLAKKQGGKGLFEIRNNGRSVACR